MNKRGILVVVSGFSGAGKGTLMKRLVEKYSQYALSVSATTRPPRQDEVHGREYFFHTVKEFERLIAEEKLFEFARYVNNYYGTPKQYVEEQLEAGKDVILEIEIQGALKVKAQISDTLLIFVTPPNIEELKCRLTRRGTEADEVLESRLNRAVQEAEGMYLYDYLLVNDELEECVDQMHMIIQSTHNEIRRNKEYIKMLKNDLEVYRKGE